MGLTVFIWNEEGLTIWVPFYNNCRQIFATLWFCTYCAPNTELNINIKILDLCTQWLLTTFQHLVSNSFGLIVFSVKRACHIFKKDSCQNTWGWRLWLKAFQSPYPNELLNTSCQPTSFQIFIQTSQPPLIGPLLPRYSTCSRDWAISKPVRIRCQWYQGISRCLLNAIFHTVILNMLSSSHTL